MAPRNNSRDRWHVGKEIPIALIFALFVQTAGWVWWAATQSAKLDNLATMVSELKQGQYTQSDARRDMEIALERNKEISRRVGVLEESIRSMQRGSINVRGR